MNKDFDAWGKKKKILEQKRERLLFRSADIWWCSIGLNVQEESCGKGVDYVRPVLVYVKLSCDIFIGIPLSTKEKQGSWFCSIESEGKKMCALLCQVRMFSASRLQRRLSTLGNTNFLQVKRKLEALLEFS